MAEGQGRSSGQGVKLLYIRDYLYAHATKEHPKNAKKIKDFLMTKGISASEKTIFNDILRLQIDFSAPYRIQRKQMGLLHHRAEVEATGLAARQLSTGQLHGMGSSPVAYFHKTKNHTLRCGFRFGGDNRTRTCDLLRVKQAL